MSSAIEMIDTSAWTDDERVEKFEKIAEAMTHAKDMPDLKDKFSATEKAMFWALYKFIQKDGKIDVPWITSISNAYKNTAAKATNTDYAKDDDGVKKAKIAYVKLAEEGRVRP